jgi:hypothetical protein
MTSPEATPVVPETRPVTIAGRELRVLAPNGTQASILSGLSSRVARMDMKNLTADDKTRMMGSIARALDVLQGLIVGVSDQVWLEDEMSAGRIELTDLLPILRVWGDQDEKPASRVRRVAR